MKASILLVEDDQTLGFLLKEYLEMRDFRVTWAANGADGLRQFNSDEYDLCLLDVMMPAIDGFTLAELIRGRNAQVPVVFLTAKSMTVDVLKGFKIGADDYIKKPVNEEELVARLTAVLKRSKASAPPVKKEAYQIGRYQFDAQNFRLHLADDMRQLTERESDVLQLLVAKKGELVSRDYVLETLWGKSDYFNRKSMDVFISRLRKYLASDENIKIQNVHGSGFVLSDE
ncbi:MAG: two-component system OmpR family response regulator [Paraglaciecola sp.]|jgi:two-component system OmpR family response regulator